MKNLTFNKDDVYNIKGLDTTLIELTGFKQYAFYLELYLRSCESIFEPMEINQAVAEPAELKENLLRFLPVIKKIQVAPLIDEVNNVIDGINENDPYVSEKLKKLIIKVEELHFQICKAIVTSEGKDFKYTSKERENSRLFKKAESCKILPRAEFTVDMINSLLKYVNELQLLEASHEITKMMDFSYGKSIDRNLELTKAHLEKFDAYNARNVLAQIRAEVTHEPISFEKRKTILAIDDNVGVLNTLRAMLKDYYEVFSIPGAKMALKFLEMKKPVNLILLDIEMPDMDGYQLLAEIRKLPEYAETPTVFLTGNATKDHLVKAVQMSAVDFIGKPVDLETLLSKINKHIR